MRFHTSIGVAALIAGLAAPSGANAGGHDCFDKGALAYRDCGPAAANEADGPYFAVRGGLSFAEDTEFNFNAATAIDNEYDLGWTVGGALGYEFVEIQPSVDLRGEIEIGYQEAEIDEHVIGGAGVPGSFGETGVFFGFVNLYGDVQLIEDLELVLGGGLGLGDVDFDGHGVPNLVALGDDDVAFGYHLDAGLSWNVDRDLAIEAMYRYTSFLDAELTSTDGFENDVDVDSHQALIGLRLKM